MPAYLVVDIHITDPVRYEEYKRLVEPTLPVFGGKYLARGGKAEVIEGERKPGRTVVVEFPSVQHARDWWSSEIYREAKRIRQESARTEMILIEGVAP
jgi:uncharacterized protein (DUF1330 family)